MSNNIIEDKIKELEELSVKLKESECMQPALNDYIASTLSSNLDVFNKFYPKIPKLFEGFKLKNYRLVCFKDHEPNVLNIKTGTLLYKGDPYFDTKEQVRRWASGEAAIRMRYDPEIYPDPFNQFSFTCCNRLTKKVKEVLGDTKPFKEIPSVVPNMIIIGGGLGFVVSELFANTTALNCFYVEPDLELFYCSLCLYDWRPFLEYIGSSSCDLRFILGKTPKETMDALESFYLDECAYVLGYQGILQHYSSKECNEILRLLEESSSRVAVRSGQFDDMMFGLANEIRNLSKYKVLSAEPLVSIPEFKNFPVVVVGNGPSLDKALEIIKEHEKEVLIIACGTALNSLLRYGIHPDIYVALERITSVSDSLKEIKDDYDLSDILCITPDLVHARTLDLFKRNLLFFKVGENLTNYLPENLLNDFKPYLFGECLGPLVSNCGLSLAISLGFKDIWLCGIDNGSCDGKGHSSFSTYYDENGKLKPKYQHMTLDNMDLVTKGNFRDTVKTNFLFLNSISYMETLLSYHKDVKVKNSSDGAYVNGTISCHLKDRWKNDGTCFNIEQNKKNEQNSVYRKGNDLINIKAEILKALEENSYYLENSEKYFKFIENTKIFNEVANHLLDFISSGSKKASIREEMIRNFRMINDYLLGGLGESKLACSLLKGTVSSMLSDVVSVLYTIEDENKAIKKSKLLLKEIENFVNGAMKLYPHIGEYVQGEHERFQRENGL